MNTASRFTVSVALLVIAHAAFAFTPYQGQWWNPDESGSGYNIDIRNGVLVMTVYSYQADGDAQWYLTAGPMSADGRSYTGTLDQYRDGQCISCSYVGRPINTGNAGTVSIAFASETAATLTLPGRDVF